jgi:2-keto-4-pentenoate hydratase/2-oxohepta-3-ene-1,7-dioic acid hydratase in catechol pathway
LAPKRVSETRFKPRYGAVKFLSFKHDGRATWGCLRDRQIVDLGARFPSYPTLLNFLSSPEFANTEHRLKRLQPDVDISAIKFDPVITRPEKIICLARNYMDHHKEAVSGGLDRKLTEFPPIFFRLWRSVVGHEQAMILPRVSRQLDWEGELAVIIGRPGRHISEAAAMDHVAGYSCFNDGSIRDYQHHAYQITPGKNFTNSGSFGPYLVTPDELPDALDLKLETRVNGETMQRSNTKNLIFGIAKTISYCSDIFELMPGDVIATGTPSGVGWGRDPKVWLKVGDRVEVEIERVGLLSNRVDAE